MASDMIEQGSKTSLFHRALMAGLVGVAIGLIAFICNYYQFTDEFFAYDFLMAPAILMLSFFSPETDFTAKLLLLLSGQFVGYLVVFIFIEFWRSRSSTIRSFFKK